MAGTAQQRVYDFRKQDASRAPEPCALSKPVFLVGFMGAGKTSVARKLARSTGIVSVDMDTFIERRCGCTVAEIFAEAGEGGFRAVEADVLRELACGDARLVSCGGGVVLAAENRAVLKQRGFTVYLKVTAAAAASRISNLATRPLFGDLDQAQRVIQSRLPLYEEVADMAIDTVGRSSASIARELYTRLKDEGILRVPDGRR